TRFWSPKGKKERFNVADQFEQHPQIGYFHTGTAEPLKYAIKVTNLTNQPRDAFVYWELAGASESKPLKLPPGGTHESIERMVIAQDFKAEKPETLTINVRERDRNGRFLCIPYHVIFKPTDPRPYLIARSFAGDTSVVVLIDHTDADPVPFPVNYTF